MWMRRGEQAAVETPGTNEKRYLAGSIHWRTGRVILTEGRPKEGRSAALFLPAPGRPAAGVPALQGHPRHLRQRRDPHSRTGVKAGPGVPGGVGAPGECCTTCRSTPRTRNPIERVWWRLHEAVTRNHRCHTMDELLDLTFDWFETRTHFRVQSSVYTKRLENEHYFRLWREVSRAYTVNGVIG